MSWRRRAAAALRMGLLALAACGRVVPAGGEAPVAPRARVVEAVDLIPADLDLVVRIDVARMRGSLDADETRQLTEGALEGSKLEGLARKALVDAATIWLGLRLSDFSAGDRVLVVHTARGADPPLPDSISWTRTSSPVDGVERYQAKTPAERSGIQDILKVGERGTVFVSPVESPSVRRVLERGPDPKRLQPDARGVVSLQYRAGRASPELQARYPSLAKLVAGVALLEAVVDVQGEALALEARMLCKSAPAARKIALFFTTIRDAGGERAHLRELLAGMVVEHADRTVTMRWPMPRRAVFELLLRSRQRLGAESEEPPEEAPASDAKPPVKDGGGAQ